MAKFVKGDPRICQNPPGRPPDSPATKKAKKQLREAIPRLLLMKKSALEKHIREDPPMYDVLAAKYITEHVPEAVARLLGAIAKVLTGEDGAPLIPAGGIPILPPISFEGWTPAQIDKFIESTAPKK